MSYYAFVFPKLTGDAVQQLDAIRSRYDRTNYGIVPPHITLLFAIDVASDDVFVDEVSQRTTDFIRFSATCERTLIQQRADSEMLDVFLCVGAGAKNVRQLHEQLYSGALREQWRPDIPYIPHITVGNSSKRTVCEICCKEVAKSGLLPFSFDVSSVILAHFKADEMRTIARLSLTK